MDDTELYPYAFKAVVPSSPKLEARINVWLEEQGLRRDLDYEVKFFTAGEDKDFSLNHTTYIFDSKAHAVFFKLTFGGKHDES